ncbi:MAG: hypothetical protein RLZZ546_1355, partial [Bacteroidota bacterium]
MKYFFLLVIIFGCSLAFAQRSGSNVNNANERLVNIDSTEIDSSSKKINTFKVIFSGKPGRAAFYSLVIPAGGQVYNKKWWKVPLALGIDGFFSYSLFKNKKNFNEADKIFKGYVNDKNFMSEKYTKEQASNARINFRQKVEYGWVYLIVGHLVTVFDAYVDRHLLEFDISPDLSLHPKGEN